MHCDIQTDEFVRDQHTKRTNPAGNGVEMVLSDVIYQVKQDGTIFNPFGIEIVRLSLRLVLTRITRVSTFFMGTTFSSKVKGSNVFLETTIFMQVK